MASAKTRSAGGSSGGDSALGPAEQLEQTTRELLGKQLFASAAFFADKLVALSDAQPAALCLHAEALMGAGQPRRALVLLRRHGLLEGGSASGVETLRVAAQCLAACGEWEQLLALLGEDDAAAEAAVALSAPQTRKKPRRGGSDGGVFAPAPSHAALCLLRGRAYQALENRPLADRWFRRALELDARCSEAVDRLAENAVMPLASATALVDALTLPPDMPWLRPVYIAKLAQGDPSVRLEPLLGEAEPEHEPDALAEEAEALAVGAAADAAESRSKGAMAEAKLGAELGVLSECADLRTALAASLYTRSEFERCYAVTRELVVSDPYNLAVLPVHVCVLAELQLKSELFYCSHQLVQAYPDRAVAWFSVGVYYLLTGKPEAARRFFAKAVSLDPAFAAAWVGVGHCFSAQDDNEQALTAYRSATRLFPTSHLPLLFIGMEYLRTSSLSLADQFLRRAEALCPGDPLVLHEHAVVHYRSGDYAEAARLFRAALACLSRAALPQWEATAFNLGHALRKLRRYDEALRSYEVARRIDARNPTVHTAIGLVHHVRGDLARAVECYHVALAVDARDTVTSELMTAALRVQFLGERPAPVGAGASAM